MRHPLNVHYRYVIMGTIASQITSLTIAYSTVYSGSDKRKHQSSASLAFVSGIHRGPVNSPHKWPVTRKIFPFDDVIVSLRGSTLQWHSTNITLSQITGNSIVYSTVCSCTYKRKYHSLRHWPLWGGSIGDPWIPVTRGQWRGKCFHFMTSLWQPEKPM